MIAQKKNPNAYFKSAEFGGGKMRPIPGGDVAENEYFSSALRLCVAPSPGPAATCPLPAVCPSQRFSWMDFEI